MAASKAPRAAAKRTSAAAVVASTLAWLVVLAVPLLGTWLAASLAAYGHRGVWPSLAMGFVVFPVVPVVWEVASTLHGTKKRWLETRDRLVLRTLAVSLVFLTVLLGSLFLCIQAYEWYHMHHEGLWFNTGGVYGSSFFVLTGFHGLHVLVGVLMIAWALIRQLGGAYTAQSHTYLILAGMYWHFVDVVWLFLYSVLYLV